MDLSSLLSEALSSDQLRRNQAEITIDQLASQNFGLFLLNCSQQLCDESKPRGIRQISATIIKNTILFTDKYKGQWQQLNPEIKTQIKQHVLSTLATNEKDIRKAAGIAVAGICRLELPINEWAEIIDILTNTCTNENKNIKLASILTLGYISQEITPKDLNEDQKSKVLSAIYDILNTSTDFELIETAIAALLPFLAYVKHVFQVKEQKILILDIIFKICKCENEKIRELSVQCLLEIARNYYDTLDESINDIIELTKFHMVKDTENISILCYEFWCSIGDVEISRLNSSQKHLAYKNYCNIAYPKLLDIIFTHLMYINTDSDSWSLSRAAGCLLGIFSQCCDFQLVNNVIEYIAKNINETNPIQKEASLLAFGAILETQHKENMVSLVFNSIQTLVVILQNNNETNTLIETSAWVIEKITDLYGQEFLNQISVFDELYQVILNLLSFSRKKVLCHLCTSIHYLSVAFKPLEGQNSSPLSKHLKYSLEILLKLAYSNNAYDATNNVAMSSFFAIGSLIENSAPDTKFIIQNFFHDLIKAFQSSLNKDSFGNLGDKVRYDYQGYISSCLEPCLISNYITINPNEGEELLDLVIQSFTERNSVYDEGLMTCSSLALCMGNSFFPLINKFGSYLIYSLNAMTEYNLCKAAIHATSDIIRSVGPQFYIYLDQIVPIILKLLAESEADKNIKPHCFNVISDIFLICKDNCLKYFNEIMDLIGSALEAATYVCEDKEDIENLEYFEKLREHIVECLTCIFHTMKDLNKEDAFKNYVVPVSTFIHTVNSAVYNPSFDLSKASIGLIADFCETYNADMKPYVNISIIEEIYLRVKVSKNSKVQKMLQWAHKVYINIKNF